MLVIAIDIGGTDIKSGVLSSQGEILEKNKRSNNSDSVSSLIKNLSEIIDEYMGRYTIGGISFTVPAITDPNSGEVLSEGSMPFLIGHNVKELLKQKYDLPLHSENDGNCAALAELWLGAGKGMSDIATVVIGTGIGGSVVKNGRIHSGSNFLSGEFGYMIKDFDFKSGVVKTWSDTGGLYALSLEMSQYMNRQISGKELFDLAEAGDEKATELVDQFYSSHAVALFNIQYMYDPEVIILGGKVSERVDFIQEIEKRMDLVFKYVENATSRPKLLSAKFGNDSNLIGAVYHLLQKEGLTS